VNKKRIAVTLFMAFLSEIANKLAPLVTLHIVATRLGPTAFGSAQYALWLIDWGIILTIFGFAQTAPVQLKDASHSEAQPEIIGSVITSRLLLAFISAISLLIVTAESSAFSEYRTPVLASLFVLISTAFDSVWVLLAKQKMALISTLSIAAKIFSVLAVLLFVDDAQHATRFVVITLFANSFISMSSFFVAMTTTGVRFPNLKLIRDSLTFAMPYAFILMLLIFIERFDLYLVEKNLPLSETGIYAASSKLVGSIAPITASITAVFYSEMLAHEDSETIFHHLRASVFWVLSVLAPVIGVVWLNNTALLNLVFGPAFESGAWTLNILTTGVLGYAAIIIFGFQLLALKRQWSPVLWGLLAGSIAGLLLSIYLAPSLAAEGIACGAVAGKILAAMMISAFAIKRWQIPLLPLIQHAIKTVIPALLMVAIMFALQRLAFHSLTLPCTLSLNAGIYILLFSLFNITEAQAIWRKVLLKLSR
jgi:O-antigen/teichoic acid export membrane protein